MIIILCNCCSRLYGVAYRSLIVILKSARVRVLNSLSTASSIFDSV